MASYTAVANTLQARRWMSRLTQLYPFHRGLDCTWSVT